jgi:uncharacterized protein (DUF697 family)
MKLWKVQKLFGDVVYDLRSRGLLPVVILLVIAMVAVPMLISRGSSSSIPPLQPTAGAAAAAPEAESAVVSYSPGIRNYKKRLDDLSPKNPFRQQFAKSAADASKLSVTNTAAPVSGGSSTTTSVTGSTGDTTTNGTSTGSGGTKKKHKKSKRTTYTYSVNVLAGDVEATLTPFKNVASITPLPGPNNPVVVYYALSADNKKALFLVSNKVDALSGPGTCVPAPDDCSLLALSPGQSEDLHYGLDGKTYRLVVSEIVRHAK